MGCVDERDGDTCKVSDEIAELSCLAKEGMDILFGLLNSQMAVTFTSWGLTWPRLTLCQRNWHFSMA